MTGMDVILPWQHMMVLYNKENIESNKTFPAV